MLVVAFDNIFIIPKNKPTGNRRANGTVYPEAPFTKQ